MNFTDTISAVGATAPKTLGFLNPALAVPAKVVPLTATSTKTSATAATSTNTSTTTTTSALSPQTVYPVGGGLFPAGCQPNTPYSIYSKFDFPTANYLGGDPNTGVNGDPGAYAGLAAKYTENTVPTTMPSGLDVPSWMGTARTEASDYQASAIQTAYNNAEWDVTNLEDPASGASYTANLVAYSSETPWEVLGCIGAVGTFIALAVGAVDQPEVLTVPQYAGLMYSAASAVGACGAVLASSWDGQTGAEYSPGSEQYAGAFSVMQGLAFGLQYAGGHAQDFMAADGSIGEAAPAGIKATTLGLSLNSAGQMEMTPGFAPPQAFLDMMKPDMTKSALATYFPHG